MRNIRLQLEYDGTDFCGWQRQPGVRTVQGTLERAIGTVLRHPVQTWGCARTDAGVHAVNYVANFFTASDVAPTRLLRGINGCLPEDVAVVAATEVPEDFHARFSATARRYVYRISTAPVAVERSFVFHLHHPLDPVRMAAGAAHLTGRHDFTSFTARANEADPVCTVRVLEVALAERPERIDITVEANRFLFHMVRVLAGTLMEVGRGRLEPEQVAGILRTKDRRAAGPTARAHGLMLVGVLYGT